MVALAKKTKECSSIWFIWGLCRRLKCSLVPSGERLKRVGGLETILFGLLGSVCFQEPRMCLVYGPVSIFLAIVQYLCLVGGTVLFSSFIGSRDIEGDSDVVFNTVSHSYVPPPIFLCLSFFPRPYLLACCDLV